MSHIKSHSTCMFLQRNLPEIVLSSMFGFSHFKGQSGRSGGNLMIVLLFAISFEMTLEAVTNGIG